MNGSTLPPEAIWACQSEFSAALHRVRAHELKQLGKPHAASLAMAEQEERAAAALWETLAQRGISHPGCYVKQNDLPTPPPGW